MVLIGIVDVTSLNPRRESVRQNSCPRRYSRHRLAGTARRLLSNTCPTSASMTACRISGSDR